MTTAVQATHTAQGTTGIKDGGVFFLGTQKGGRHMALYLCCICSTAKNMSTVCPPHLRKYGKKPL